MVQRGAASSSSLLRLPLAPRTADDRHVIVWAALDCATLLVSRELDRSADAVLDRTIGYAAGISHELVERLRARSVELRRVIVRLLVEQARSELDDCLSTRAMNAARSALIATVLETLLGRTVDVERAVAGYDAWLDRRALAKLQRSR